MTKNQAIEDAKKWYCRTHDNVSESDLRAEAIYKGTYYKITLFNGDEQVAFFEYVREFENV